MSFIASIFKLKHFYIGLDSERVRDEIEKAMMQGATDLRWKHL